VVADAAELGRAAAVQVVVAVVVEVRNDDVCIHP